jgi:hypothetical protein
MRRRLLVAAPLTAGLLAAAACGGHPAGHARPALRPAKAAFLSGVSATSGGDAWAVGGVAHAAGNAPLIEHWNGRSWQPMRSSGNNQNDDDYLAGVSAISADRAWAVGGYLSQYVWPLIFHWHGAGWKQDANPTPGGDAGDAALSGVAAVSPTLAWAVGGVAGPGNSWLTLIFRWNGSAWAQVPSPSPAGRGNGTSELLAVAAVSPDDAWAVGKATTGPRSARWRTLIEHWNGTNWTVVPSPDPARAGCVKDELDGVAASPAGIWAVGDYCGASLVVRLDAGQWRQVPSPRPPAGVSERLASVAVTSAASAWAVGGIGGKVLILHWNGSSWATVPAPSPAGARLARLAGVSAVSRSTAWAVGEADYPHRVRKLLIERWDGTTWQQVFVPNPTCCGGLGTPFVP